MGCSLCRSESAEFEHFIAEFERSLNIDRNSSGDYDNYFHKYAVDSKLDQKRMLYALEALHFDSVDLEDKTSKFSILFSHCHDGKLYDKRKLVTLGVMLGSGSKSEKLNALFLNSDDELTRTLDSTELRVMIEDICFIALEVLPSTAKHSTRGVMIPEELTRYLQKLQASKRELINHYEKIFIPKEDVDLTEKEFIALFDDEDVAAMLKPSELRKKAILRSEKREA
jgi:hypothetical protein